MLTKSEFNKLFKSHEQELLVRQSNKVVVVSSEEGGACPHWGKGGCRIYQDRPIDCRVYPYIMTRVIEKRNKVKIVFHARTDCPQKDRMYALMSETDASALVREFGKKLYGKDKTIIVQCEKGLVSRLRNRIETAISRRRFK
jgi:Fe-S-cluster containining protein